MMSKYDSARGGFKIFTADYEIERAEIPSWMDSFAASLEASGINETAVEMARKRDAESIADQINAIMNGKNTHSSVEEAIKYYQERTGLAEYINKINAEKEQVKKVLAQAGNEPVEALQELREEEDDDYEYYEERKEIAHNFGAEGAKRDFESKKPRNFNYSYISWILKSKADGIYKPWMESMDAKLSYSKGYNFTYNELSDPTSKLAPREEITEKVEEGEEGEEESIYSGYDDVSRNKKYVGQGYRDGMFNNPRITVKELVVNNPEMKYIEFEDFWERYSDYQAGYRYAQNDKEHGFFEDQFVSRQELEEMYGSQPREKSAQVQDSTPELFKKFPEIKFFIENMIRTRHGYIDIPAVQNDILDVYKSKGITQTDVDDPTLLKYINDIIGKEQSQSPDTDECKIGEGVGLDRTDNESDPANTDAFNFANTAKI